MKEKGMQEDPRYSQLLALRARQIPVMFRSTKLHINSIRIKVRDTNCLNKYDLANER